MSSSVIAKGSGNARPRRGSTGRSFRSLQLILLGSALLVLLAVIIGGSYGGIRGNAGLSVFTTFLINLVLVLALQVYSGNSGEMSFGIAAFMGIGAYVGAILSTPVATKMLRIPDAPFGVAGFALPIPAAAIIAIAITILLAIAVGFVVTRISGMSASLVTMAMLVVVHSVLINWDSLTGGAEVFLGVPLATTAWIAVLVVLGAVIVARLFRASQAGLQLQASREDEIAAWSSGVNVVSVRRIGWIISAALAGVAGVLLAHFIGSVSPRDFYFERTFLAVAIMVVGGQRGVMGAVIGSLFISAASEVTRFIEGGPLIGGFQVPEIFGLTTLLLGLAIVLMMIFRPYGLVDDLEADQVLGRVLARWRSNETPAAVASNPPIAASPAASGATASKPLGEAEIDRLGASIAASGARSGGGQSLAVKDVRMDFGGLSVLEGVSLEVRPGEIVGLIGPNGAGKTTLVNIITSQVQATGGSVVLGDRRIDGLGPMAAARLGVARTFQNSRLFRDLTVRQNIEVPRSVALAHRHGASVPTVDELLEELDLVSIADRRAGTLAYGTQRRVEIARGLALGPEFLLLDEPGAGMGPVESDQLLHLVLDVRKRYGCGIIVIDHDLTFIMNVCDRIYVLAAGHMIANGRPDEVRHDPAVIAAYVGAGHSD